MNSIKLHNRMGTVSMNSKSSKTFEPQSTT